MGTDGILLAAFAFFAALVLALLIALVLQNRRISDANSALSELLSERLTAQSARANAELFKLNQSLNDGLVINSIILIDPWTRACNAKIAHLARI